MSDGALGGFARRAPKPADRAGAARDRERHDTRGEGATPKLAGPAPAIVGEALGITGRPLEPDTRQSMESGFGRDLGHVRIHTDTTAALSARAVGARAYTVGQEILFGTGRYQPQDQDGRRLLRHEITHVLQQATAGPLSRTLDVGQRDDQTEREAASTADTLAVGGHAFGVLTTAPVAVAREEPSIEDFEPSETDVTDKAQGTTADPTTDPDDDLAAGAPPPFTHTLSKDDPSVVFVPASATRAVIGSELGVTPADFVLVGPLEAAPLSEDLQGIRFTEPSSIPPPLLAEMRTRLDAMVGPDVSSTVNELIAESGGWKATRFVLRWSQYDAYRDAAGKSYFDRYLDALDATTIVTTRDYWVRESKTSRTGLEELLEQTSGDVHAAVLRARSLSGRAGPGDTAYSADAPLPLGHVVGRWISGRDAATVSVQVAQVLFSDIADRDEAEIRLRNAMFIGGKVMIRSSTGRWYGYGVFFGPWLGDIVPPVVGGAEEHGQFSWYYPSTMFVGQGEVDPNGPAGNQPVAEALQKQLLGDALTSGDNRAPISLDLGALKLATTDQRIIIFQMVVGAGFSNLEARGYSTELAVQALVRTVMAMPPEEFAEFERQLDEAGITAKLLATKDARLAPLGAAFTFQTMAGTALGEGTFADPTELVQGTTSISQGLNYYLANVQKPTAPGERTTLSFEHGYSQTGWRDTDTWSLRSRETTRVMKPTDLVSIETISPSGTHRRIASAFEAALTQGDPESQVRHESFMDFLNVILLAQAGAGLLRLGGAGLRAMATGSLRAAMRVLAEELATQAGSRAARSIVDYALFSASRYVSHHQEELEKTPEGRAFMAMVTAATALLAVRDVGALVKSGAIERLIVTGRNALGVVSEGARVAVRRTMLNFRAARLAWDAMEREGLIAVTNVGGFTMRRPTSLKAFGNFYRVGQAQAAGERLMTTLGPGATAERASATLGRLEKAAGKFERPKGAPAHTEAELEAAKAYREVAKHLGGLPGKQRLAVLDALDRLMANAKRPVVELAPFIRAALKAGRADVVAYLDAVVWLSKSSGISRQGFARLGENALGTRPVDLEWLSTRQLSAKDLDDLAVNPKTSWKTYRDASLNPTDVKLLKRAQRDLRGHAAEVVAAEEATAGKLAPGYRVTGKHVEAGGFEIDLELTSIDGLGRKRLAEVKGWTPQTWKRSLDAYRRDPTAASLTDPMDVAGSRSVKKMLDQLADARAATPRGELPILAVTEKMTKTQRTAVQALVAGKAEMIYLPEAAITTVSGRLARSLGIR
jgi:hypothetical protein